ncbi:E3 ubiquitin-protein ligase BRE1-like [Drosophila miranda]|uniref:E3 ubiquitin-protein ligase BRE1-like n=1 Tax=Drosophila miranda TaxID=7229 RepID=UPI00143F7F22|nr:E3 ubiquitin-protein ligase BRE1-like [Drosophila miranda]
MGDTNDDVNDLIEINMHTSEEFQGDASPLEQPQENDRERENSRCQEAKDHDLENQQAQPDENLKQDTQQEKSVVEDPTVIIQKLQQQMEELQKNSQQLLNQLAEIKSQNVSIQKTNNELQPQNPQVDEASTKVNQILKKLEWQISKNATLEDHLEEQDKSTKFIIQELEQQIAELDLGLFRNELEEKERAYLEEVGRLRQRVDNLYTNITCSLCQAPWTSEGEHRLISLYCGHLFGKRCIERLSECPICGLGFGSTDMRYIYGRNILPAD